MYLGNSSLLYCNQVFMDTRLLIVAYVADCISIHLNEFGGGDIMVLYPVVNLEVGADGDPLIVGYCGAIAGYIPSYD